MTAKIRKSALGTLLVTVLFLLSMSQATSHFNFALPDKWSMTQATANNVQIIWGHPYEGIYFDAPNTTSAGIIEPDGTKTSLTPTEITVSGKKAWQVSFTPSERGDYIVYADFETLVVEEEEVAWEDHVKAIVHYKTSEGWDQTTGQIMEIIPLTRPYGMEEGFIFTGQVFYNGQLLANASIEIEKYYPLGEAPDPLPEEPLITRETKADPNGIFSFTIDEAGVWVVCAINTVGTVEGYDKDVRGILMIPIEEEFPPAQTGGGITQSDLNALETSLNDKDKALEGDIRSLDDKLNDLNNLTNLAIIALTLSIVALIVAIVATISALKKK